MKDINLSQLLKQYFGFDSFKSEQEAIIQNVLSGSDTFVLMPTGGGKSLCYQMPALLMEGTAIVISPLIALMKNQVDAFRRQLGDEGVAHFINSSLSKAEVEHVKDDILCGRTKLLYVAPESLTKADNVDFLQRVKISFYAVDEAHCISEWGHDFRPEYRRIRPIIEQIGVAPIIALTATATEKVRFDIKKNLGIQDGCEFKCSFNRPNLYYEVRPKTANVESDIARYILQNPGKSGIVYCLSRKRVELLAEVLRANNIKARAYHAGMDSATRTKTQDDFLHERIDVIVATIAFGMGIDKPDVRFVIHYETPKSLEGYYQETGRAGRDGAEGRCIAFYSPKDLHKLEKLMEGKPVAEQDIGRQLMQETQAYMESPLCRRRSLLHYFGEIYGPCNCGNCDNCLEAKAQSEATSEATMALSAIDQVGGKFKTDHVIDVLMGCDTDEVLAQKHHTLPLYGCGRAHDRHYWNTLIRQEVVAGLAERQIETLGNLRLTARGRSFLVRPWAFEVVEEADFAQCTSDSVSNSAELDEALMDILNNLRWDIADREEVPPYVVFYDNSIEEMATLYPVNIAQLTSISGVSPGKAQRYGNEFCHAIAQYCTEHHIEPQADIRVRTLMNKSKNKVSIVQGIDRQLLFPDIAKSLGKTLDELMEEVEAIVYSGTKLNIDYYIEEVMDTDHMEEIYDYFHYDSETDSITEAYKALGSDFTEDEIRLVRVKFLSEMAN